jgi:hypothetical protein
VHRAAAACCTPRLAACMAGRPQQLRAAWFPRVVAVCHLTNSHTAWDWQKPERSLSNIHRRPYKCSSPPQPSLPPPSSITGCIPAPHPVPRLPATPLDFAVAKTTCSRPPCGHHRRHCRLLPRLGSCWPPPFFHLGRLEVQQPPPPAPSTAPGSRAPLPGLSSPP